MSIRKVIFWTHLTFGASVGIAILTMSVTGALLVFQPQIQRYADRNVRKVEAPLADAPRLGPDELIAKVRESRPEAKVEAITLESCVHRPIHGPAPLLCVDRTAT
jgi:uncharacterized iron-regulated membrane protein